MNAFFSKLGWAREPDKRDYYLFLIESFRRDNNHTDVIKAATDALGVYPNDAKFYQLRGLSYYELFQHHDAILDFKFVHALEPNNDIVYHHLLDALNSAALYKEAILLADEAIAKYQEGLRENPALAQKAAELIIAYNDKAMHDYAVRSGLLDLKTGAEQVWKSARGENY
jgi:tetratricopeptide (TPR) repeat protein